MARSRVEVRFFEGRRYARYPRANNNNKRRYFVCLEWDKTKKRFVSRALHRDVWISARGPIPDGCHIHHKNNEWGKNDAKDLGCLGPSDHRRLHGADPEFKRITREWHSTPYAKRVRRRAVASARKPLRIVCENCGKKSIKRSKKARFCSVRCGVEHRTGLRSDD
jgi:hypothetical protein